MQPYEIRQLRDGSIDYNNYYARPARLLTPAMHRFWRASLATLLIVAAAAVLSAAINPPVS